MHVRNPITGLSLTVVTGKKALEHGVSREEQDEWSYNSHRRYFQAYDTGIYKSEILPVEIEGEEVFAVDESPRRDTSLEKLASLRTAYGSATVTAGNAPGLNDGASVVILMYVEIGMLTPPVGFNVYVVKAAVGDTIPLETIFRGCFWFLACEVVIMSLLIGFPQISLWLPNSMG